MWYRGWIAGLVLALALVLSGQRPGPAADKTSSERIDQLIQQLGSSEFSEREKATTELEKLGSAALKSLQKAAEGEDAEISRRARAIVTKLERRATAERVLQPKRVHLVYKDTPLSTALADLQKQSGYSFQLIDPEQKLKDRKVTLDTGETTFWHALALFCDQAGLVEGTMQDLWQARPGAPRLQPAPPIPVRPQPGVIRKGRPLAAPQPAAPPQPADKEKPEPADKEKPAQPPQPVPPNPAAQVQVQVQVQQGGPVQVIQVAPGGMGAMGGGWGMAGFVGGGQNMAVIYLKDGKPKAAACDDHSAVRVRIVQPLQGGAAPAAKDRITLGLEVRPEPRLGLAGIKQVRVEKAVDDQGQTLEPAPQAAPGAPGAVPGVGGGVIGPAVMPAMPVGGFGMMGFGGGLQGQGQIQLQAGEKPSKSLKQLKGVVSANLINEDHPCVTVENVLQSAGKTFKGEQGAFIKVLEVKDKEDEVTLRLEMQQPNQAQGGMMPFPILIPAPQIQPVPAPPAPGAAPPAQPAKRALRRPVVAPRPMFREGSMGLTLRDDEGKSLPLNISMQTQWAGGGAPVTTCEITCKREKGKTKPSKLVLAARTPIDVDIPFTIENVPLP